jgi:hypothetical protein
MAYVAAVLLTNIKRVREGKKVEKKDLNICNITQTDAE